MLTSFPKWGQDDLDAQLIPLFPSGKGTDGLEQHKIMK
jgi:hypothetical protein